VTNLCRHCASPCGSRTDCSDGHKNAYYGNRRKMGEALIFVLTEPGELARFVEWYELRKSLRTRPCTDAEGARGDLVGMDEGERFDALANAVEGGR
jgi:hypothetical protein